MSGAHEDLDERLLHRLLFFSDAVFAIVMTLLVLDLHPPELAQGAGPAELLSAIGGKLFAFALSLAILGIFWIAHLSTTRRLQHFDWPATLAILGFLFPVCLIPFASSWLGSAVAPDCAWGVYAAVMMLTSVGNIVMVLVQSRGGGRLIAGGVTPRQLFYRVARSAAPGVDFAVGVAGAITGHVRLTQFCWVLIPIYLLLVRLTLQPKEERRVKTA